MTVWVLVVSLLMPEDSATISAHPTEVACGRAAVQWLNAASAWAVRSRIDPERGPLAVCFPLYIPAPPPTLIAAQPNLAH